MSAEIPVPGGQPAGPTATPTGGGRIPLPRTGTPPPGAPDVPGYELMARLGRGAQSAVYRVRREADGLEYALKIVDVSKVDTSSDLVAFRREAALLASIDHPGLARIHEVGEADGRPYLVMDLIRGRSLADLLVAGPMPAERVVRLGLDIVAPLAAIHGRDLVHRDVKPANVMVLPDGSARLIDFGLTGRHEVARGWAGSASAPEPDSGPAPSPVAGTLLYAPPEQSGTLNRPVDNRSDLYALGVVLFECLAGRLPFQDLDVGELLRLHATAAPPDLRELVPGLPPGLAEVVATLLSKDPDDRYQVGEHVAAHLRALATDPRFRPAAARAPKPVDQGRPLVGRRAELTRLKERWEQARRGQGGVVLVRGAIGSGKSRFLDEFVARVRADGRAVLNGRCAPDDPVPFAPVRAAVDAHLESVQRLPPDRRAGDLAVLTAAAGRGTRTMLGALSPGLARALGVDPDGGGAAQDDEQFTQTVIDFLSRLATARGELLLVMDDSQWADAGTVLLLRRLAAEIPAVPMLVVIAARSEDVEDHPSPRQAIDLDLGPLTDDEVREQVEHLVPGLGSIAHLSQLLAVRSNGNPFIVQEYVRAVVDAGLLRPSWGTWVLDVEKLGGLDLPQDAVGLVLARVRGLRPPVRELLVTAAAMGRRFRAEVVAAVVGRDAEPVVEDLAEAVGRRLLESLSGGEFGFVHTRIREALLDDLRPAERSGLHGRIAVVLDARSARTGWGTETVFAVAHHYLAARGADTAPDPERALDACRHAGRLALEHHSSDEAVAFLEYAVELSGQREFAPAGEGDLWRLLGTALHLAGRLPDSLHWLRRALAAQSEPVVRAEILAEIADLHRAQWDAQEAAAAVDRGLAEVGAALPRSRAARVLTTFGLFLAAQFSRLTGIGFGRSDGEPERRYRVISRLNDIGVYAGLIDIRLSRILLHTVRLVHAGVRIGSGPEYARGQAQLGLALAVAGRRRAAVRAFGRARADLSYKVPGTAARVEYQASGAAYLAGWDNGEQMARCVDEYGRWLTLGDFLDGVAMLHNETALRGRSADAEHWLARGRDRMGSREGLRAFSLAGAVTHALRGEAAEAGAELNRVAGEFGGGKARGLALVRIAATLTVLNEQGEQGEPYEAAVAELEALGIDPRRGVRPQHGIVVLVALGRLAQLRWSDPTSHTARLAAAREAVGRLPEAGLSDVLRARAVLARADLLLLEGRYEAALELMNSVPLHFVPDAPMPALEARLVRARVLVAMGAIEEARRLARAAAAIAQEEGWPHRVRSIASEFGIAGTEAGTHSVPGVSLNAGTSRAGAERRRLLALQQVSAAASRVIDPRELARITLDETIAILNAERAFLFLLEGERLSAYLGRDASGGEVRELTGYSTTLVERVRDTARPLVVTGTEEGAALGAESVVLHGLRSIMVAPLLLDKRLVGVVYLDSQVAKGIFTPDDVSLLTALTNHIATGLETARAAQLEIDVRTVQRQRDVAEMLQQTQDDFSATLDPDEVIHRLLRTASRVTGGEQAWMISIRHDQAAGECNLLTPGGNGLERRRMPLDPGLRRLLDRPVPLVGSAADVPMALGEALVRVSSWITVPLRPDLGGIGVLVLATGRPGADLAPELEVAAALGTLALTAYERAVLFSRVQELAVADDLTGIPNRRRFFEVAERDFATARRHGRDVTALMIDIDHFKAVNDAHGHATGDEVIREVARRLAETVRQTDLVARYGGEEFALLLPDAGTDNTLPDRLRAVVADEPVATRSGPVRVTVSVGQAVVQPTDDSMEALLARADGALYEAKRQGRNRVCRAD